MSPKITPICLSFAGLIILGACSKGEKAADRAEPSPARAEIAASPTPGTHSGEHGKSHPGGTTIETNGIHLEMVPEVDKASQTHLDLYVQNGENHEPIPTAKVIAQVQAPDGKQQNFDLKYDEEGKHYATVIPSKVAGQYQVKIAANISGKKVDGRFTFNR